MAKITKKTTKLPNLITGECGYVNLTSKAVYSVDFIPIKDEMYTLSFYAKANGTKEVKIYEGAKESDVKDTIGTLWKRIVLTFTSDGDAVSFELPAGEFYLWKGKLEEGTLATDWSDSEVDEKNELSALQKDYTSKIEQNYNKIMLSVNTKADKTETEASITLLEGKIEQKVTIGESYNGVTIDENGINAEGTGSLVISMANVELTEDGYMIIQGGEIGPLTITNDEIYANFFEDKKSYSIDFTYEQTTHTPQGDVTKDISTSADLIYTESLKAFRLSVDNIFKEMIFGFFYDEADLQDETPAYIYTQDGVKKAYTGSTTAVYKYFTDDNTLNVIYKNELYELDEKDTYGIVDDTYTRTSYKFVNGDDFIYYYSDTPTPPSSGTTDDYDESLAKAIEDAFGNVIGKDMKAFDVTKSHFKLGSGFDYEYIHDLLNITSAKIGGFNISESSISTDGMSLTSKTDDGVASVSVYGEDENNAYQQVNVNHKDSVTMYGMNKRTGQLYKTGKMSNVATTDELSGITYSTGRLALNGYSTTTQQPVEDRIVLDAKDGVVLNTDVIKLGSNNVKNIGNRANKSTSSVSVKSADHTVVCSQQLTAGTFIVVGSVRFQGNATGYRQVNIGSTDWTPENAVRSNNVGSSSQVIVEKTRIITLTETTTINLYAFQNSGVTLDCGGRLSCIRITS